MDKEESQTEGLGEMQRDLETVKSDKDPPHDDFKSSIAADGTDRKHTTDVNDTPDDVSNESIEEENKNEDVGGLKKMENEEDDSFKDEQSISHSEDKVILFDPQTYLGEMELKNENRLDLSTKRNECTSSCIKKRNLIALLSFFGFFNVYCLRVDLSITLVAMTNPHVRMTLLGEEYMAEPEFDWDTKLQGHILGAFFYGYLITQIPGGYIAARFGGKNLFGIAILLTSLLTLLTPWASRKHVFMLIILRFLEGICEGCIYPCMYAIWSRWAPPQERAKLSTVPHAGSYAGSVAGTLVSGILCELAGWSFVFYLFGTFGILWSVIWFCIVVDSPSNDTSISEEEKIFIEESLKDDCVSHKVQKPPWLKFLTSVPFIAILVAHTCEGWGFSTMQTCLPKYLTEALNMRISVAGVYSAILYFMMGIVVLSGGQLADVVRQRGILSTTNVRKLFTCAGFIFQALAFSTSINFSNIHIGVIILVVGGGIEGLAWAGFAVNHLDIAPRYASILFGITNTSATIPGILSPLLVGYLTENKTKSEWHLVFYIGSATFVVGALVYGLFASAEKQPWADYEYDNFKDLNDVEADNRF